MENVSIKLETPVARRMEKRMGEFNYSTKTEFIRDAIRGKLKELDEQAAKKKAWAALFAMRGAFKGKGKFKTDAEFYEWRNNEGSKELMEYYEKKFGLKEK